MKVLFIRTSTWLLLLVTLLCCNIVYAQNSNDNLADERLGREKPSVGHWDAPTISPSAITGVNLSNNSIDFSGITDKLIGQLKYDPIIEVNTNRGTLTTSFNMELPPNIVGYKNITFTYNSLNTSNAGYGRGWNLALPRIEKDTKIKSEITWKSIGQLGNSELVATDENLDAQEHLLQNVAKKAFSDAGPGLEFTAFRPLLDERFVLFVQVKSRDKATGFIALTPSGKQWAFDSLGRPILITDIFDNSMMFEWSGTVLKKVVDGYNNWEVTLEYLDEQQYPQFRMGKFFDVPLGIKRVLLSHKDGSTRSLDFHYNGEYLTKVKWNRGKLPLFQGSYKKLKSSAQKTNKNPFKKDDKKIITFFDSFKSPTIRKINNSGNKSTQYIDLNNDGREDRITVDNSPITNAVGDMVNAIEYEIQGDDEFNCKAAPKVSKEEFQRKLNNIPHSPNITVEIAVWDGKTTSFQTDHLLNLSLNTRTIYFTVSESTKKVKDCKEVVYYNIKSHQSGALNFIDMDMDGRKDVIACQAETTHGPDNKNRSRSILALLNGTSTSSSTYVNTFNMAGSSASVFRQVIEKSAVDRLWKRARGDGQENERYNYLLETSSWKHTPAKFKCNPYSLFVDVNSDGHVDVITGRTLYLLGDNGRSAQIRPLNNDQLKKLFEDGNRFFSDIDDLIVTDTNGNGKLELINAKTLYKHPVSGKTHIVRYGKTKINTPGTIHKVLNRFQSHFGGTIDVDFQFRDGRWVVTRLVKDSDTQNSPLTETSFYYETPIKDPYMNIFTGFSKTRQIKKTFHDQVRATEIIREFYKDIHPEVVLYSSRGRLNGRVRNIEILDYKTKKVLRQNSYTLDGVFLGNKRIHPFRRKSRIVKDGMVTIKESNLPEDHWWKKNGMMIIPLRVEASSKAIDGMWNVYDEKSLLHKRVSESEYLFLPEIYKHVAKSKKAKDKNSVVFRHTQINEIRPDNGLIESSRAGERISSFTYDPQGRIINFQHSNGKYVELDYVTKTSLIKTRQDKSEKVSYGHNLLTGEITKTVNELGISYLAQHSSDGLLVKLDRTTPERERTTIYQAVLPESSECPSNTSVLDNHECLERSAIVHTNDTWTLYNFDGFGNVISSQSRLNDLSLHSGTSTYADGKVVSTTLPSFTKNGGPRHGKSFFYDAIGRKISEQMEVGMYSKNIHIKYLGLCRDTYKNSYREHRVCTDGLGNTFKSIYRDEVINFDVNANGDVLGINDSATWDYNLHGELIRGSKGNGEDAWAADFLKIDEQGLTVTSSSDFIRNYDEDGRLLSAGRGPGVIGRKTDLSEVVEYDHGLMKKHNIKDFKDQDVLRYEHQYNDLELVSGSTIHIAAGRLKVKKEYQYDNYGREIGEKITAISPSGQKSVALRKDYKDNQLNSLGPIIEDIEYDELGMPYLLRYKNGLEMRIIRELSTGNITNISYMKNGQTLWSERVKYSLYGQVTGRVGSSKRTTAYSENFNYDENHLFISDTISAAQRDRHGRVKEIDNGDGSVSKLEWNGENLSEISWEGPQSRTAIENYHNSTGSLVVSCPKGVSPAVGVKDCFYRLGNDEVVFKGTFVKLIRAQGIPVALAVNYKVFPVILDYLGSIRGLLTKDGGEILFTRHYGAWGDKTTTFNTIGWGDNYSAARKKGYVKHLERFAVWSYAGLIENPLLDNSQVGMYWSQTRVYSPELKKWLSVDPLLKWGPKSLVNRPGNWKGVRYSGNDPLNFVDPSGNFIVAAAVFTGFLAFEMYRSGQPVPGHEGDAIRSDHTLDALVLGAMSLGNKAVGALRGANRANMPKYHPRIRQRAIQDPKAHNFPRSFDKQILKVKPSTQGDGSLLYRHRGTMNGKEGSFEMAVNPKTNTIFHRMFRPNK